MKLKIGDTVTVNILGRNITARISSLRQIEWESLAINFVMVFSPNTLKAAPHNLLATVRFPTTVANADKAKVSREIGRKLPSVTMINVRDAIAEFAAVFGKVMIAVRVAAGITLLAGAIVLAGALATAQRRRVLQAVVLKCIGATRRKLLLSHFAEYGLLAAVTALIASRCRYDRCLGGDLAGIGYGINLFAYCGWRSSVCVGAAHSGIWFGRYMESACCKTVAGAEGTLISIACAMVCFGVRAISRHG